MLCYTLAVFSYWFHVVAHGRMVTSSRQITEVKQRRARLVAYLDG